MNDKDYISVTGSRVKARFSKVTGYLQSLKYKEQELLKDEVKPSFWRAMIDNDRGNKANERLEYWLNAQNNLKLHSIESSEDKSGIHLVSSFRIKKDLILEIRYDFKSNEEIAVRQSIKFKKKNLPELPRFGMRFVLDKGYDSIRWFGRGPHDNYQDRKTSALYAEYQRN